MFSSTFENHTLYQLQPYAQLTIYLRPNKAPNNPTIAPIIEAIILIINIISFTPHSNTKTPLYTPMSLS